jgi:hypothetical protein
VNKEIVALFFSVIVVVSCRSNGSLSSNLATPSPTPAPTATPATSGSPQLFTYKLSKVGLQFEWLEGWRVERQNDNSVVVAAPDNGLVVHFSEADTQNTERQIEQYVRGFLQDAAPVKMPKLKEDNFKGMKHLSQSGQVTNALNGATIEWSLDVLEAQTPLIIFSQLNRAYKSKHESNYAKLISSLKRIE